MRCCTVLRTRRSRTTHSRASRSCRFHATGSTTRALLRSAGTIRSCCHSCARSTVRTALSRSSTLTRTSTRGSRACSAARRVSVRRSTTGRTFIGQVARDSSRMAVQLQVSTFFLSPPSITATTWTVPSPWSVRANFWGS